jgi:hypothetical protein
MKAGVLLSKSKRPLSLWLEGADGANIAEEQEC